MQYESMRQPWQVWAEEHKLMTAKYEHKTTGQRVSGVLHLFDNLTVPAMKDGPIESNIRSLVPILFHHGLGQDNGQYSGQLIELASHGYLCISVADTHGAGVYT